MTIHISNCKVFVFCFSDPLKAVSYDLATKGQFKFQVKINFGMIFDNMYLFSIFTK